MFSLRKVAHLVLGALFASSLILIPTTSHAALYSFTTFTFTPCGATGSTGPTYSGCNTSYGTTWSANSSQFSVTSGIQNWVVPRSGSYQLLALGASGGTGLAGAGFGASIRGNFNLTQGDVLRIAVG